MVATSTRRLLGTALFVTAALVAACERGGEERGALTALTGAPTPAPRPDTTVPTTRTIDNAGFVDPAGHTDEETLRSEMSGMRATESGSERITGTPGYGLPLPIEPSTPRRAGETGGLTTETPAGRAVTTTAAMDETIARVARARCDRETGCDRIGPGHRSSSQASCAAQERVRARQELSRYACGRGVDMISLGTCLNTLRALECEVGSVELAATPECASSALCPGL